MFTNPFIHARTVTDWIVGIAVAVGAAGVTALFLILATRAFN
jgi:hypothetical protein